MSFENDRAVARELVLWLDNNRELYTERTLPLIRRLCCDIAIGVYKRAHPGIKVRALVLDAALSYGKEFKCDWRTTFPDNIRAEAADIWVSEFEDEYECNQHDGINPVGPTLRRPLPAKRT